MTDASARRGLVLRVVRDEVLTMIHACMERDTAHTGMRYACKIMGHAHKHIARLLHNDDNQPADVVYSLLTSAAIAAYDGGVPLPQGNTPLFVKHVIQLVADVRECIIYTRNYHAETLLHAVVRSPRPPASGVPALARHDAAAALLRFGFNPDVMDSGFHPPIQYQAMHVGYCSRYEKESTVHEYNTLQLMRAKSRMREFDAD